MQTLTSLVLVDDDVDTLAIWSRCLNERAGFRLIGVFANAESALPFLLKHPPDLLLADLQMPGMNGFALIALVKHAHPSVRAVLITNHDLEDLPLAAVRARVDGCLLKPDSPADLPARLRAVMSGTCVFSARVMQRLSALLHSGLPASPETPRLLALLTARERDVLRELSLGLQVKQVADRLGIFETTVKAHKEHIFAKLGVKTIAEAVAKCTGFTC